MNATQMTRCLMATAAVVVSLLLMIRTADPAWLWGLGAAWLLLPGEDG